MLLTGSLNFRFGPAPANQEAETRGFPQRWPAWASAHGRVIGWELERARRSHLQGGRDTLYCPEMGLGELCRLGVSNCSSRFLGAGVVCVSAE